MEEVRRTMNAETHDSSSLQTAQLLLSLARIRGIKNRKALDLFGAFKGSSSEEETLDFFLSTVTECLGYSGNFAAVWDDSMHHLSQSEEAGVDIISFFDERYPLRLRTIDDPPVVLFVKGNIDALHAVNSVAVVGTREPTKFGERAAYTAGKLAAESGIVVVSGLALGCDTQAHEGCVSGNGLGVAVLAHGLERVYPASNRFLADRLLDCGGCLVSEVAVGVKPTRWGFAYRDRIQSGLSDRVLVVETDVKGGTMHTVEFSRKQQRPLACIDHPVSLLSETQSRGNQRLIREGLAIGITDETQLRSFLGRIANPMETLPSMGRDVTGQQLSMGL